MLSVDRDPDQMEQVRECLRNAMITGDRLTTEQVAERTGIAEGRVHVAIILLTSDATEKAHPEHQVEAMKEAFLR